MLSVKQLHKTRLDLIKDKSAEEMADFLLRVAQHGLPVSNVNTICDECESSAECKKSLIDWLVSENG